jgi:ubiquinone/menaquinone biosynthesis C-methylase UbiE
LVRRKFQLAVAALAILALCWLLGTGLLGVSADQRQEIDRLSQLMQWHSGTIVADIGAGDGTYSYIAAGVVGPSGHVYATEIDPQKLKQLRAEVAKRKLSNVTVVEGAADDTKLPSDCCDAIFLRHVYHHITKPVAFDQNLVRSLKPGAHLAIIDFPPRKDLPPVEGVPANRGGHGIPQKVMEDELTSAGLKIEKVVDDWWDAGYCVIFVKSAK